MFDPRVFKRPSLLIVGCGDIGLRVAALLRGRWRLLALTSSPRRVDELRAAGITPLLGNLDDAASLARLAGLGDALLHLAPPAPRGSADLRTASLLRALARRNRLRRIVYISTSGVYGDCAGAHIDETRAAAPATERARRRVDAERRLRAYARTSGVRVTLLRVPGIYALGRAGGNPAERVARGAALPEHADTVYTNHIHADDLARACVAALYRGRAQRVVHVSDDSEIRLGAYFDLAADLSGQARLPRLAVHDAGTANHAVGVGAVGGLGGVGDKGGMGGVGGVGGAVASSSFAVAAESRRLLNDRLKTELRLHLRYPTVAEGLAALQSRR